MKVLDSSIWLEYFTRGRNVAKYRPLIHNIEDVIVPSIVLYEVFKKILREQGKTEAVEALGQMQRGQIIGVHASTAIQAAQLSVEYKIGMADAMILAIAKQAGATLWTQDTDFEGLPGVEFHAA